MAKMGEELRKTAIKIVGDVPWGTHFCQFYETKEDLLDILVPYFKAGLEGNEFCMWITSEPLSVDDARNALKKKVKALDDYIKKGQIEILDYTQWYTKSGRFRADEVLKGWAEKEKQALTKGFDGLRLTGNTLWLEKRDWRDFADYEATVNRIIGEHNMLAVCTYCLDRCTASEIIDVVSNHQFALIKREGTWEIIESTQHKETLEALQLSEERLRQVSENIREVFWLYDLRTNKFVYVSSAYEAIMGRPVESLYKDPKEWIKAVYPGDRGRIEKNFAKEQRGEPFEDEYRIVRTDGSVRWINDRGFKVYDDTGRVYRIAGIAEDITERRHAEEVVRSSQQELRISNQIAEIFLTTADDEMYSEVLGVLLEAMESKYGIFGYIHEDDMLIIPSMTRDVWDQCRIADKTIVFPREKWGGIWGRALLEKRSVFANEGLHVPEGHVPITRVLVVPILYAGRTIGLLEVANKAADYSHKDQEFLETIAGKIAPILNARLQRDREERERKQAEEALRRSEERYALAQRAAEIGSWDWNILTGALTWSETIEPMFGFNRGEFGKTYEAFLDCIHPEDRAFVIDSVGACVEGGEDYAIEHRIVWPDGTVRWVSETGDVIQDEGGKATRMLGIVQDITERKAMESRQRLAARILECVNQESVGTHIIHNVLSLIKEHTACEAVGIRLREADDFPYFVVEGFSREFVKAENYLCARNERGEPTFDAVGEPVLECMCGLVLSGRTNTSSPFFSGGGSFWTNSTTELLAFTSPAELQTSVRGRCNRAGYESVALIPLRSGEKIIGLLQLNDRSAGRFSEDLISFFERIGASIGIALARVADEEKMRNLAKFPSENPYPVIRIAKDGIVLYGNSASGEVLKEWDCEISGRVPEHWQQYVLRILNSGSSEELEVTCGDKVFSLTVAPVVDAGYVNIYGVDITKRKQTEEDLRKYRQHLEELVQKRTAELTDANKQLLQEIEGRKRLEQEILGIGEREQRRIGQELHDSIGQQFTGIAFMTKVLTQKLSGKLPEEAADAAEIGDLVNQAMEQARGLAKGLHPVDLDAESLASVLQELAATTEKLFAIRCTFKCDDSIAIDDTVVAVHLYRIAQEAVNNAIKHGQAKNIGIELTCDSDKSVLMVKSDGLDFPGMQVKSKGMGLQIMDHRAEMIGGSLDIRKAVEGGTIMTCEFPNKKTS
ncbi:MAG: MEDS domain-containing protein [Planctomycetota bacterium]|nr:MAG: MEDS domain-containing protein [Planctomycetota bacterium]